MTNVSSFARTLIVDIAKIGSQSRTSARTVTAMTSDIELKFFLLNDASAALRNVGDNVYLADRVNGMAIQKGLSVRTSADQVHRVLASMTIEEKFSKL